MYTFLHILSNIRTYPLRLVGISNVISTYVTMSSFEYIQLQLNRIFQKIHFPDILQKEKSFQ